MQPPSERYRRGVDKPTLGDRARRVDPLVWDSLLAAALAAISVIGGITAANASPDAARHDLGLAPYVLVVLGCAPLAVRRRWPLAVLIAVSIASIASASLDHSQDLVFALVIASYTAAAYVDRERFVRVVVPVAVTASIAGAVIADPQTNWVEALVAATFSTGLPMLFGRIVHNRHRRIAAEQERAARDAVTLERARIARELHDVVAHAMSVMVVQAGAARRVIDDDPGAGESGDRADRGNRPRRHDRDASPDRHLEGGRSRGRAGAAAGPRPAGWSPRDGPCLGCGGGARHGG